MQVEGFETLGKGAFSHKAAQLAVRDKLGNLVAVAVEIDGVLLVSHRDDEDFEELTRNLGLTIPTLVRIGREES